MYERERNRMVDYLKEEGLLRSKAVEQAMRVVPRHLFVARQFQDEAYDDVPLPTAAGQTTSAPSMVAIMCEVALPFKFMFEVGCGTGYLAAVCALAQPDGVIVTSDLYPELASAAAKNFELLGIQDRVHPVVCDGSLGPPTSLSPDTVVVSAAAPELPPPLIDKLQKGGKIVIPLGIGVQELVLIRKTDTGMSQREITTCVFVPLLGKYGYGNRPTPSAL